MTLLNIHLTHRALFGCGSENLPYVVHKMYTNLHPVCVQHAFHPLAKWVERT